MIVLAILLGGFFGFALYKVGAANMDNLLSMLSLRNLTLMKIILFAIGLASVLVALFYAIGLFDPAVGTCPGTCVAGAMTGGFKKAISAVLGGLVGAFLFSMSYGWLADKGFFDVLNLGKLTLFHVSDKYPSVFKMGYGGLAIVGVIFITVAIILPIKGLKK